MSFDCQLLVALDFRWLRFFHLYMKLRQSTVIPWSHAKFLQPSRPAFRLCKHLHSCGCGESRRAIESIRESEGKGEKMRRQPGAAASVKRCWT